jgi:hypothetical protein
MSYSDFIKKLECLENQIKKENTCAVNELA